MERHIIFGVPLIIWVVVLEAFISKRRDSKAVLVFLKEIMKRYGKPNLIVTDILRSYRAAMKVIKNQEDQEAGR